VSSPFDRIFCVQTPHAEYLLDYLENALATARAAPSTMRRFGIPQAGLVATSLVVPFSHQSAYGLTYAGGLVDFENLPLVRDRRRVFPYDYHAKLEDARSEAERAGDTSRLDLLRFEQEWRTDRLRATRNIVVSRKPNADFSYNDKAKSDLCGYIQGAAPLDLIFICDYEDSLFAKNMKEFLFLEGGVERVRFFPFLYFVHRSRKVSYDLEALCPSKSIDGDLIASQQKQSENDYLWSLNLNALSSSVLKDDDSEQRSKKKQKFSLSLIKLAILGAVARREEMLLDTRPEFQWLPIANASTSVLSENPVHLYAFTIDGYTAHIQKMLKLHDAPTYAEMNSGFGRLPYEMTIERIDTEEVLIDPAPPLTLSALIGDLDILDAKTWTVDVINEALRSAYGMRAITRPWRSQPNYPLYTRDYVEFLIKQFTRDSALAAARDMAIRPETISEENQRLSESCAITPLDYPFTDFSTPLYQLVQHVRRRWLEWMLGPAKERHTTITCRVGPLRARTKVRETLEPGKYLLQPREIVSPLKETLHVGQRLLVREYELRDFSARSLHPYRIGSLIDAFLATDAASFTSNPNEAAMLYRGAHLCGPETLVRQIGDLITHGYLERNEFDGVLRLSAKSARLFSALPYFSRSPIGLINLRWMYLLAKEEQFAAADTFSDDRLVDLALSAMRFVRIENGESLTVAANDAAPSAELFY